MSNAPLSIEQFLEIEPGDSAWVNDPVIARVISVEKKPKQRGGDFWKCEIGSDTSGARVSMSVFTAPRFARGDLIEVGGRGNRRKDYHGTPELSVGKGVEIHVIDRGASAPPARPPAQRAPADDSRGGSTPPPPAPDEQPPPAQPPAGSRPMQIEGQTVGMAENQACEFLRWAYEDSDTAERVALLKDPTFWALGKHVASVLIRLSGNLKAGHLAPSLIPPKPPAESPPPTPAPEPPPKPASPPPVSTPPPPAKRPPPADVADEDVPF